MFLKISIFLTFTFFIIFSNVNCENCDLEDVYLHLFGQIENVKTSLNIVNTRLDILSDRSLSNIAKNENIIKPQKAAKPIFDIRFDNMPQHCPSNAKPSCCAEATECTGTSGIYNITDIRLTNRTFTVYCDNENYDGDWLYILKREDGSENFNRPWKDYVQGFGNVAGEYWLGLEYIYALTNFYGPHELLVFIENFDGIKKFSRYDNFVIGSAEEHYTLKSLGRYWGTAGDSLFNHIGGKFSTFDVSFDSSGEYCAKTGMGGFWFNNCGYAHPTAGYLRGSNPNMNNNLHWYTFGGYYYSHKTMILMIRRKNISKLEQ